MHAIESKVLLPHNARIRSHPVKLMGRRFSVDKRENTSSCRGQLASRVHYPSLDNFKRGQAYERRLVVITTCYLCVHSQCTEKQQLERVVPSSLVSFQEESGGWHLASYVKHRDLRPTLWFLEADLLFLLALLDFRPRGKLSVSRWGRLATLSLALGGFAVSTDFWIWFIHFSLGWVWDGEFKTGNGDGWQRRVHSLQFLINDSTTCSQQIFVSIYYDGLSWGLVWVFLHSCGCAFLKWWDILLHLYTERLTQGYHKLK